MNPTKPLLPLVAEHWESIRTVLSADERDLLLTRMRALAETSNDTRAVRRALQGVRLALLALPLDHPVRLALDTTRLTTATADPATAVQAREVLVRITTLSTGADTHTIIAGVQRRLLAAPSLSPGEVRARCVDEPPAAELIGLDHPVHGIRYPAFQFTGTTGGPLAVVRRVNALLLADIDPWGAADWWLSGNTWLGAPPASLIGELPDEALAGAARALVEGD